MNSVKDERETGQGDSFSFVDEEHKVLKFWHNNTIFEKSLQQTRDCKPYVFYDGPPFATGLPHHGHLVGSVLKDIVPRYFTMKGFYVQRRFGWDCHGLPIEHEIDKSLGLSAQEAVSKMGLKGYNDECRGIVQRYTKEWKRTISRVGRWVDFEHDYKTMDANFMESVWWVLKQLWERDLIYQGIKVVPVSTALGSVLSNFEAGSNYKEVQDPAVTVLFKLTDEDVYLAAWTTTPWTLPSNLGLCVGDTIDYVKVKDESNNLSFIVAEHRLKATTKNRKVTIQAKFKGNELVGRQYTPLFPHFRSLTAQGAFRVLSDDYVTTDSGTGIVHLAPAFGEDDYRIFKSSGLDFSACPVTLQGYFTDEIPEFNGMPVKTADKQIINVLKKSGQLYNQETVVHNYPFCPRSDTPIIYRAVPSWYVKVEKLRDALVAANNQIHWEPRHIKHGRMENWLKGAVDWAISRNRYWGTPIPIWINDLSGKAICIGSKHELQMLTGAVVNDLHRENIDDLVFSLPDEPGEYHRISEVLDCWFESGSMPYAQLHYPFENTDLFEQGFPAEFIAEGLDQTRGWFYTLIVLSTALFDKPAFKNVVVNGIVLAADGKKMSKRLKNYTPPDTLMETYGADALRLYLINTGLVKAEEQRFNDLDVKDMVRSVLLPWYNAFKFLQTYAEIDHWKPKKEFEESTNRVDQWILSKLQSLKISISQEMEHYKLYRVIPALFEFLENLTNWYVRLNRVRFWQQEMSSGKNSAFNTLYQTLLEFTQCMAPFAPFLAETIYQAMHQFDKNVNESVHLCGYPVAKEFLIKPNLEDAFGRVQQIIILGRKQRNLVKIKTKIPLSAITVIHKDQTILHEIRLLENYISTELNVKEVRYTTDEEHYIVLYAKANLKTLGKKLGKQLPHYKNLIESLSSTEISKLETLGALEIEDHVFTQEDIFVFRKAAEHTETVTNRYISIDLDCTLNQALIDEGLAREVVNRIQKTRKEDGLMVADRIVVHYCTNPHLQNAIAQHKDYIMKETLCVELTFIPDLHTNQLFEIEGNELSLTLKVVK